MDRNVGFDFGDVEAIAISLLDGEGQLLIKSLDACFIGDAQLKVSVFLSLRVTAAGYLLGMRMWEQFVKWKDGLDNTLYLLHLSLGKRMEPGPFKRCLLDYLPYVIR